MRKHAAALNRAWLIVIGVVVLMAGLAGVAVGLGLLGRIGMMQPTLTGPVVPTAWSQWLAPVGAGVAMTVGALVVGVLAVAWLVAQVPRSRAAKDLRLHRDALAGITMCSPSALADAVATQVEGLPGVAGCRCLIRGSAAHPDVTLRVEADERADLDEVLRRLTGEVAQGIATTLETTVAHLAVQLEIGRAARQQQQLVRPL